MKIWVNADGEIMLEDVFNAIGIRTDAGDFGICQRDGGIEVVHKGKIVYSSYPAEEALAAARELQTPVRSGVGAELSWIHVDDEVPPDGVDVLVYLSSSDGFIATDSRDERGWIRWRGAKWWAPLPAAPRRQAIEAAPAADWKSPPDGWLAGVQFNWQPGGLETVQRWLREHTCRHGDEALSQSAIGGRLRFEVCPTGVGTFVDARCGACGRTLKDLTNLSENA